MERQGNQRLPSSRGLANSLSRVSCSPERRYKVLYVTSVYDLQYMHLLLPGDESHTFLERRASDIHQRCWPCYVSPTLLTSMAIVRD